MIRAAGTSDVPLRVCLDLNIWIADLLAAKAGRTNTAAQILVDVVRGGQSSLGPIQLVISWGMLNRLTHVLHREFEPDADAVQLFIMTIATYARRGPEGNAPYLLLGGTGVVAVKDEEDGHVLDTVMAGQAELLVTRNFKDFLVPGCQVLVDGELALVPRHGGGELIVAVPRWMMRWLEEGRIELP